MNDFLFYVWGAYSAAAIILGALMTLTFAGARQTRTKLEQLESKKIT